MLDCLKQNFESIRQVLNDKVNNTWLAVTVWLKYLSESGEDSIV